MVVGLQVGVFVADVALDQTESRFHFVFRSSVNGTDSVRERAVTYLRDFFNA